MATHSNPTATPPAVDPTLLRPPSEFDAGLNASTAWTEHLERTSTYHSVSDDEKEVPIEGRAARALYDFEGRADFRELSMKAGDAIEVLKEHLPDGWSLVGIAGEAGLIPQTYYTYTTDFTTGPALHSKESSNSTIGPNDSTPRSTTPPPLTNQRTGEWSYGLPNFRQSLLGGKSLNRFSSFVTSGAEEWVLNGSAQDASPLSPQQPTHRHDSSAENGSDEEEEEIQANVSREADQHFVDSGPVWKSKLPEFQILVHSPSKRSSVLSGSYTVYTITSVFLPPPNERNNKEDESEELEPPPSPKRMSVHRRFSHFVFLHTALTRRLPGIALPPLPEKQYAGRFSEDFVEARRGDLERYLNRLVRHPVARYAEVVTFFLGCESELEWRKKLPHHLAMPPAGPQFYARVFHPAFNLDVDDATESVERFSHHLKAVDKGVQGLRGMFGSLRQARMELAKYQRLLSYSLLSLITSAPLATTPTTTMPGEEEEEEENTSRVGLLNSEGAWCWREHCDECLRLTKAMQKTAETIQAVADLQEDNAKRVQLATHEALKDVAHPSVLYAPVIDTHKSTLSRYKSALKSKGDADEITGRCETVLNTTMSEFSTYHSQKQEDFERIALEHLNGEIELHASILERLQAAKAAFYTPEWEGLSAARSGPRQASRYERDLPRVDPRTGVLDMGKGAGPSTGLRRLDRNALVEPAPHVWDSAPMRPVSAAIQEGMGMLFGSSSVPSLYGRGSVFGRLW